jgi:hypothetical protein
MFVWQKRADNPVHILIQIMRQNRRRHSNRHRESDAKRACEACGCGWFLRPILRRLERALSIAKISESQKTQTPELDRPLRETKFATTKLAAAFVIVLHMHMWKGTGTVVFVLYRAQEKRVLSYTWDVEHNFLNVEVEPRLATPSRPKSRNIRQLPGIAFPLRLQKFPNYGNLVHSLGIKRIVNNTR